jgi:hypothetical protein
MRTRLEGVPETAPSMPLTRRSLLAGAGRLALLAALPVACTAAPGVAWADGTFWDDGLGWRD